MNIPSHIRKFLLTAPCLLVALATPATETVWLGSMDFRGMTQGWGAPNKNRSVTGTPLSIAGEKFARGVGTHAISEYKIRLDGRTDRFVAKVGLDDDTRGPGSVIFRILGDGRVLFNSGVMRTNTAAKAVDVNLRGVKLLVLEVRDANDGISFDHGDWADGRFIVAGARPVPLVAKSEPPYILTPRSGKAPRLNNPVVFGARPGHPFLYRIPAQGQRPLTFAVDNLPPTLRLDAENGVITGTTPEPGSYSLTFKARNRKGEDKRSFRLVSGDQLSLTPSMGWNHWYAHYDRVTDKMMRQAADILISSGMADVGYQYVNIDDCWMNSTNNKDPLRIGPFRDLDGSLLPNQHFPDMKGLTDYIHSRGLKAGIYTSPGPLTCGRFAASWQHEAQDARLFAEWGFDFLKYDWCSYGGLVGKPPTLEEMKRPYTLMGGLLRTQNRDILFNLCQYGMGDVWKWGAEVGGQSWRTSGDLGFELNHIFQVALKNCEHRDWQKPGAWNDPDYLQIGYIGNARGGGLPAPCPLSPNEQYAFMSLWCLMAAPLFYSGDMARLDDFTLNILCNPEVIEIDQDPLGECARVIPLAGEAFIMHKQMVDGSRAIGLANPSELPHRLTVNWDQLGLGNRMAVRDLWRQKNLGDFKGHFSVKVPPRFVFLVRVRESR